MSIQLTFPFDNPVNYTFDDSKVDITGGQGTLILVDLIGQSFTEDFINDTGFTYDSDLVEFSGGQVQQKDTRPTDSTFYASFSTNINGNWGDGALTGTGTGGPTITGNKLDLSGGTIQYVDFDANLNADSQQTGCIRFRYTPDYNGSPPSSQIMWRVEESVPAGTDNGIAIFHENTGDLRVFIRDQTGATIVDITNPYVAVSGTEIEVELNYDITAGTCRLFVDGNIVASDLVSTGTRDANIGNMRIGSNVGGTLTADFLIRDVLVFSTVQHTANYTPDWSNIYETIYVESVVTLPVFTYSGLGDIQSFDAFTPSESNTPHYTVNGEYWNGSAWVSSDDSYNQANTGTIINTNISTSTVADTVTVKIVFTNSNTQQSAVSNLSIEYTGQEYSQTNPLVVMNTTVRGDALLNIAETATKAGSDEITYNFLQNGTPIYYNGAAWVNSDGTYAQSNTAAELVALLPLNADTATTYGIQFFLHSDDGSTTPTLQELTLTYDIAGPEPDTVFTCEIYFDSTEIDGDINSSTVTVQLENDNVYYKDSTLVLNEVKTLTPDIAGRYTVDLVETVNMNKNIYGNEQVYILTVDGVNFRFNVPEENTSNLFDNLV